MIKDAEFVKFDYNQVAFKVNSNTIKEMHDFLFDPHKKFIRTGLAIGVQNFLLKNETLFAGIRKEAKKNDGSLFYNFIGEGASYTDYRVRIQLVIYIHHQLDR